MHDIPTVCVRACKVVREYIFTLKIFGQAEVTLASNKLSRISSDTRKTKQVTTTGVACSNWVEIGVFLAYFSTISFPITNPIGTYISCLFLFVWLAVDYNLCHTYLRTCDKRHPYFRTFNIPISTAISSFFSRTPNHQNNRVISWATFDFIQFLFQCLKCMFSCANS